MRNCELLLSGSSIELQTSRAQGLCRLTPGGLGIKGFEVSQGSKGWEEAGMIPNSEPICNGSL